MKKNKATEKRKLEAADEAGGSLWKGLQGERSLLHCFSALQARTA